MLLPLLAPPLLLGAAVQTYNFFEGERLLHDLWYEFHLARADLASARVGPFIVEEYDATCLAPPGVAGRLDPATGAIILSRA